MCFQWDSTFITVGPHSYLNQLHSNPVLKEKKNMRDCFTALFQPLRLALPFNKRETE